MCMCAAAHVGFVEFQGCCDSSSGSHKAGTAVRRRSLASNENPGWQSYDWKPAGECALRYANANFCIIIIQSLYMYVCMCMCMCLTKRLCTNLDY